MMQPSSHTASPVVLAGVACFTGFDLHAALGYAGEIVGLVSGVLSIVWVAYQFITRNKPNAPKD
jgi:hypothetical protein